MNPFLLFMTVLSSFGAGWFGSKSYELMEKRTRQLGLTPAEHKALDECSIATFLLLAAAIACLIGALQ